MATAYDDPEIVVGGPYPGLPTAIGTPAGNVQVVSETMQFERTANPDGSLTVKVRETKLW